MVTGLRQYQPMSNIVGRAPGRQTMTAYAPGQLPGQFRPQGSGGMASPNMQAMGPYSQSAGLRSGGSGGIGSSSAYAPRSRGGIPGAFQAIPRLGNTMRRNPGAY